MSKYEFQFVSHTRRCLKFSEQRALWTLPQHLQSKQVDTHQEDCLNDFGHHAAVEELGEKLGKSEKQSLEERTLIGRQIFMFHLIVSRGVTSLQILGLQIFLSLLDLSDLEEFDRIDMIRADFLVTGKAWSTLVEAGPIQLILI